MLKLVDVQIPDKGFCDSSSSQAKTKNKRAGNNIFFKVGPFFRNNNYNLY